MGIGRPGIFAMPRTRESEPIHAPLPEGTTFVRIEGPPAGEPLVLIHGATVPSWELHALVPPLWEAGFRTIRFDLYGHGRSDRPRARYRLDLFVRQTAALLAHLGLDPGGTALLGHSMGAAVAASVAARQGARRLGLMAPMRDFHAVSRAARVVGWPVLGELVMAVYGRRALIERRRRRYEAIGQPELADWFREQVRRPGYWRALVSMQRNGALADQSACYRNAGAAGHEPVILWGTADAIIPRSDVDAVAAAFPRCQRVELEGLEHKLMLTHPRRVVERLLTCWGAEGGSPSAVSGQRRPEGRDPSGISSPS